MVGGVILLRGTVSGPNQKPNQKSDEQAECDVLAWRAADHAPQPYARFKIVAAPRHLPDGTYTVTFGGQEYRTRKTAGWWSMEVLEATAAEAVTESVAESVAAPALAMAV